MVEKGEILKKDLKIAEVLNTFFGNKVKNRQINQEPLKNTITIQTFLQFKTNIRTELNLFLMK